MRRSLEEDARFLAESFFALGQLGEIDGDLLDLSAGD